MFRNFKIMAEARRQLFYEENFDYDLSIGDELIFDKPELTTLTVDLTWERSPRTPKLIELDVCAFLLDKEGFMIEKDDLVYFGSKLRWKPTNPHDKFDLLDGDFSTWPAPGFRNLYKWVEATLPVSADGGVIGSWYDKSVYYENSDIGYVQLKIKLNKIDVLKHQTVVMAAFVVKKEIEKEHTFADVYEPVVTVYNNIANDEITYSLDTECPGKDVVCFAKLEYNEHTLQWSVVPLADGYNGGIQFLAMEVFQSSKYKDISKEKLFTPEDFDKITKPFSLIKVIVDGILNIIVGFLMFLGLLFVAVCTVFMRKNDTT